MKELQSLDDIFTKRIFRIPDYQRGYAWRRKQLIEFWEDLINLSPDRSHYTGVLSIKAVPKDISAKWTDEKWLMDGKCYSPFYVVDGQQRLTTISIFIHCLIEAVRTYPDNARKEDSGIYVGAERLSEIKEGYIVITEPKHRTINTYKFGYEVDNPSSNFLRFKIFNEPNAGSVIETFYTLNLENAKVFFSENIASLISRHGISSLENLYKKLTRQFLFNLYEISDNFDVFVAFETMNNRGKKLSDLELLKNRLIYLTTLYAPAEVNDNLKEAARKNINDTWGEIYNQLGRNKLAPLNDDDFLKAHWIMYFKYSRNSGNDYITFLLDEYFSPKNIFEKSSVTIINFSEIQEVKSDVYSDDEEEVPAGAPSVVQSKLTITQISDYVNSLRASAKIWYATFFPNGVTELSNAEQLEMDKINRVKVSYFRPLIMAAIIKTQKDCTERLLLLEKIERFIFISFRLCRAQSNYGSSHFYRATRAVYLGEKTLSTVVEELNSYLAWAFDKEKVFKASHFSNFMDKKFAQNGSGFYGWNDLSYFLFEYEEYLKISRGQPKLGWTNFIKGGNDTLSIEHIFPQTADSEYWKSRFSSFNLEQQNCLLGSLGNLLPLSSSINSSLQNDDFPDKKEKKQDNKGKVLRNGYTNGSYSELEVAKEADWTAQKIKERGLTLLAFLEKRWNIKLGDEKTKVAILHLSFLSESDSINISDKQAPIWVLKGRNAFAQDGSGRKVYVRDLIDYTSHEFTSSKLSYEERLQIIESVGIDSVFSDMAEISVEKGRRYSKEVEGKEDLDYLQQMAKRKIVIGS